MKEPEKTNAEQESADFFEAMPLTAGHFVYRDDAIDDAESMHTKIEDEIRTTAIITLILVAVVAVALGLLVWKGLGTIKGTNTPSANTSSYEL